MPRENQPNAGRFLLAIARLIFGERAVERVFRQIVADMREECTQIDANGDRMQAVWCRVRAYAAFAKAACIVAIGSAVRLRLAAPLAFVLFATDCTTKQLAVDYLEPEHVPHAAIGDVVRFTLGYNDGAAMSLPVGPYARWPLIVLSFIAFGVLLRLIWASAPGDTIRRVALGLLLGGTIGNLLSRLASPRGVVDFIDIGVGTWRFWIFNVADVGITVGACLLAWTLWSRGEASRSPVPS